MSTEEVRKQAHMLALQIVMVVEKSSAADREETVKKLTHSFMDIFELGITEGQGRLQSQQTDPNLKREAVRPALNNKKKTLGLPCKHCGRYNEAIATECILCGNILEHKKEL